MEPATPDLEAEGDLGAHSVLVQKNCFMRWVNKHLKTVNKHIADLATDLSDGLRLIALVEVLSGKRIRSYNRRPNTRIHQLDNVNIALKFLKDNEGIKIVNIRGHDIVENNLKLILGLIWTLILHYSISVPSDDDEKPDEQPEQTPKQRLLAWIRKKQPKITATNFTTDWNDGRAIGALVNAFAPGLCPDWESWLPENALLNCTKAMDAAEQRLHVSQLIEPAEMCEPKVDELSVMTYLSQFRTCHLKSPRAESRRRKMALLRILVPVIILATSVLVALSRTTAGSGAALLIVDVQNCFTSGGSLAVPDADAVIPVINRLRSEYAKNFDLVVLSQDWHCSDHVSFVSQHPGKEPFDTITLSYLTTGELCKEGGGSSSKYAVDCSGMAGDRVQLTQVLWPDHCVANTSSSLFNSELNVLPTDLIIQEGEHCHIDSYSAFFENGRMQQTELNRQLAANGIVTLYIVGLATDYSVHYSALDANILGYKTYVVVDATRGISAERTDTALAVMKHEGIEIIYSTDIAVTFTQ